MRFLYSVKKHSINVHFYKFNDATNLQLKQKQVFESKLTQVLQKWGKNDNESLSRSTLNLYLPNVSKHDYIK